MIEYITVIDNIFQFLLGQLETGNLSEILGLSDELQALNDSGISGIIECISAALNLIFPISTIISMFLLQVPLYVASVGVKVILRVKSFIPTMGH